jgi:hypothetical protein
MEEQSEGKRRTSCSNGHVGRRLPCYLLRFKVVGPSSRRSQAVVNLVTLAVTRLKAATSLIERMCQSCFTVQNAY